jgi:transposase InsO family protein
MSFTGRCYDNSRMESFFATLKKEKIYQINTKELSMSAVKSSSSDILKFTIIEKEFIQQTKDFHH